MIGYLGELEQIGLMLWLAGLVPLLEAGRPWGGRDVEREEQPFSKVAKTGLDKLSLEQDGKLGYRLEPSPNRRGKKIHLCLECQEMFNHGIGLRKHQRQTGHSGTSILYGEPT